ncbi:MAG: hypothetical protein Ta2A_06490 [Treponemataceae bacterium]|nr:MAG: hypothetical protein Ta2A_06490 [Treponemataceae bacterium]
MMQYTKGSIIYFEGGAADTVFVLQTGAVSLTSLDIASKKEVVQLIKDNEFFGVKSAISHKPREETATALTDAKTLSLTPDEFEKIFSANKQLMIKMLRVFSNQLRAIHHQIDAMLELSVSMSPEEGIYNVAKSFYNDEMFFVCVDICRQLLERYPNAKNRESTEKLSKSARIHAEKSSGSQKNAVLFQDKLMLSDEKTFSLPAFQRFAKQFKNNSAILLEYEPGNTFYLIQSGYVQLLKSTNGSTKNLDILSPGEFFGEMAILENSPRSATCIAVTDVEVLEFNKENFGLLITGNPQIALILLKLFCKRIFDQKRRFKILCIPDVQTRIADVFLMLDEMSPPINASEKTRTFNVTVADIAHWAGTSVDVTRGEINRYVQQQRLQVSKDKIVVTNIGDLRRIVDIHTTTKH